MEAVLLGPLGRTVLGAGELTIGCDPDNQLIVTDIRTAAHHALIRPDGSGFAILDLGSAYGTRVNGQWLDPNRAQPLQAGDVVQIGNTSFTYEVYQSASSIPTGTLGVGIGNAPWLASPPPSRSGVGYGPNGFAATPSAATAAAPIAAPMRSPAVQPRPLPYTPQPWITGGMTSYPPQQQLWRQDRRRLYLSLGVMLVAIIIVSLISMGLVHSTPINTVTIVSTPDKTLDTFCNARLAGDEQLAYSQLSSKLQNQPGSPYKARFSSIKATACAHTPATITSTGAKATLTETFPAKAGTSNKPATSKTVVTLVKDANGIWKIDTLSGKLVLGRFGSIDAG